MKDFFLDIFKYHHHFNQKLLAEIEKHNDRLPATVFPLFSHCLYAHQVWNARILGTAAGRVFSNPQPDQCADLDTQNYQDTLKILLETDLQQKIEYHTSQGLPFHNTIREILFHVANHHTHHRGQIIANFRQSGIEPLVTDYIFYKR